MEVENIVVKGVIGQFFFQKSFSVEAFESHFILGNCQSFHSLIGHKMGNNCLRSVGITRNFDAVLPPPIATLVLSLCEG